MSCSLSLSVLWDLSFHSEFSLESIGRFQDKYLQKVHFRNNGVALPDFMKVRELLLLALIPPGTVLNALEFSRLASFSLQSSLFCKKLSN